MPNPTQHPTAEAIAKVLSEHVVITDGLYEPTGWCATCGNLANGDQENHQAFVLFAAGYSIPGQADTIDELEKLGRGSAIVEPDGCVWVNDGQSEDPWGSFGEDPWGGPIWTDSSRITLPVTVLREVTKPKPSGN